MNRLNGKVALITGAGSGFGAGIARKFIEEGAQVGVVDINGEAASSVAQELGDNSLAIQADITSKSQIQKTVDEITKWAGPINVLVNNAGIGHLPTPMEELDEEQFDKIIAVNMRSIYLTGQIIVPLMKSERGGSILNIASTAGISPRPNLTWYNASKGWVITATKSMAIELASNNIRVNALNPVAGETPLLSTFMGEDTPEIREKFLSTIPLGRFSTPEDMGQAAVYLCSDESSLVTGTTIEIDGGRTI
jgi:3-oxoacyl-[acyl-carrier protein] reductase